jgi:glycogen operon protein
LIAEAWDAAGLYQVGSFIGDRWNEWNGKFRDDIRRFVRGDEAMVSKIPARLLASPDLFAHEEREPEQSINFITCHDGFTLNDLVTYNQKHNEANKEDNQDGHDQNFSWNCGEEGISDDPRIETIRTRQIKNFLTINLMSLGTPMLLMGDEIRRTQFGNNNAYCQDNEISWMNWTYLDKYPDIHRFLQRLISIRLTLDVLRGDYQISLSEFIKRASISWHGVNLNQPDWGYQSRSLAATINCVRRTCRFHFMLNSYWKPLIFEIPSLEVGKWSNWRRMIDTSLTMPDDICEPEQGPIINNDRYSVGARSIVILVANGENKY